jgi:hypothetical protein
MDLHRIDRISVLLAFGFTFIVQTIITGEQGYMPVWIMVPMGLSIGLAMLIGSGYLLVLPRASVMRSLFSDAVASRTRAPVAC